LQVTCKLLATYLQVGQVTCKSPAHPSLPRPADTTTPGLPLLTLSSARRLSEAHLDIYTKILVRSYSRLGGFGRCGASEPEPLGSRKNVKTRENTAQARSGATWAPVNAAQACSGATWALGIAAQACSGATGAPGNACAGVLEAHFGVRKSCPEKLSRLQHDPAPLHSGHFPTRMDILGFTLVYIYI